MAHLFLTSLLDQGHFSLGISRDSCTSKGAVQREEGERGENDGSNREKHRKQWLYLECVVHGGIDK